MKKTYIFCGFTKEKKFGNKISAYFKNDMKETNSIVFVPGEYRISSKTEHFIARDLEWFKEIGIEFQKVYVLGKDIYSQEEMKNILINANVIFLMSGFAVQQNKFLEENGLKEIIRDANGIVIGISAGAINLGKISVCSKDTLKGIEKTSIYKGIGRIDYSFEPHFNMKRDFELNPELKYISSRIKLYGISNDIGIKILDNKYEVIEGHMYIIENKNVKEVGEIDRCC